MEDSKTNFEGKSKAEASSHFDSSWKEFDEFYEAHSLQLFGMNFPKSLCEKLFFKLKNEIFDAGRFFEIIDNQPEDRMMLKAKQPIKKDLEVFLVDHCWTFKIRQFNDFCEKYPDVIQRVLRMLKYSHIRKEVPGLDEKTNNSDPNIHQYLEKIKLDNNFVYLEYDDMDIIDPNDDLVYVNDTTQALSLENNKIDEIQTVFEFFKEKGKNIKAVWLTGNPFEEINENYEEDLTENFRGLEIINRKFTKNATKWSIDYLLKTSNSKKVNSYDQLYGKENLLDLSGRDPLNVDDLSIFSAYHNFTVLDLRDNDYNFSDEKIFIKFHEFLKNFPKVERILTDENLENILSSSVEDAEEELNLIEYVSKGDVPYCTLLAICPKLNFINDYSIHKLKSEENLKKYLQECFVRKNIWKICQTYRLVTSEKFDEEAIWYINDEIGTAINHSDNPNFALFPLIFSPSNTFKDDMITYSVMWPLKDIKKGEEIYRDYLANISEQQLRSARLTVWYETPSNYFLGKYKEKMNIYEKNAATVDNILNEYEKNINKLSIGVEGFDEELYLKTFNFNLLNNKKNSDPEFKELDLVTKQNVIKSISLKDSYNFCDIKNYFYENFINKNIKIKVLSDLPYVRENLNREEFELTNEVNEADILWLNLDYFKLAANPDIKLKSVVFKNQYPFENIITMKSHLTDLVQSNFGLNKFLNLSYNMDTELSEIIGNFYYNSENNLDNSWILKPINMTRSMDMIVTNNIDEIIRNVETGPKICQKYLHQPYLLNRKKFDLRFIILLKSLVPLELYFYSKMFWVRSANKDFTMDSSTFSDYEVHFTVMNYNTFGMQTIYQKEFLEYLQQNNVEWSSIYTKIKSAVKNIFLLAGKDCIQMNDPYSRAIYGLDIMIDTDLEPKVLEINFSPDCTRACKFVPEFFDDVFATLFLNKPSGVESI